MHRYPLLFVWLALTVIGAEAVPDSCRPVANDAAWFQSKHEAIMSEVQAGGETEVAFLGDSLIAEWQRGPGRDDWTATWAPRGAINLGLPADRTEHVLWRIQQGLFDSIEPRVVVVLVGTNNLKSGDIRHGPEATAAGVRAVVEAVRSAEPTARIVLLALLPRQPKYEWIDAEIRETNIRLAALQRELDNVVVVDCGIHFRAVNGAPSRTHMRDDNLHLKASGYATLSRCIVDLVDAGLGD